MKRLPIVLAIETAGSSCAAAVARGATIVAAERRPARHGHGEILLPMIDRVVRAAGLRPGDLDWVAVAIGPGGFTGIRVGLAAAHGISLASGARGVGVSSFAAAAAAVRQTGAAASHPLLVALDSRRDDLYVQLFAPGTALPLAPPQAVLPDRLAEYAAAVAEPLLIAGDAAAAAAAILQPHRAVIVAAEPAPDACGVASEALRLVRDGAPPPGLRPLYLRPPDVSLPRARRPAGPT